MTNGTSSGSQKGSRWLLEDTMQAVQRGQVFTVFRSSAISRCVLPARCRAWSCVGSGAPCSKQILAQESGYQAHKRAERWNNIRAAFWFGIEP